MGVRDIFLSAGVCAGVGGGGTALADAVALGVRRVATADDNPTTHYSHSSTASSSTSKTSTALPGMGPVPASPYARSEGMVSLAWPGLGLGFGLRLGFGFGFGFGLGLRFGFGLGHGSGFG